MIGSRELEKVARKNEEGFVEITGHFSVVVTLSTWTSKCLFTIQYPSIEEPKSYSVVDNVFCGSFKDARTKSDDENIFACHYLV